MIWLFTDKALDSSLAVRHLSSYWCLAAVITASMKWRANATTPTPIPKWIRELTLGLPNVTGIIRADKPNCFTCRTVISCLSLFRSHANWRMRSSCSCPTCYRRHIGVWTTAAYSRGIRWLCSAAAPSA